MGVKIPPREGAIFGVVWPTDKHRESAVVYAAKEITQLSIIVRSRRDHSFNRQ